MHRENINLLAEQLERHTIELIQAKDWDAFEAMLDPACQFVGANGSCDRAGAMTLIKGMHLGPVQLKDFQATQSGNNLIVSFWLAAIEFHEGKQLSPRFSPRLSVWREADSKWLCIAYADLITI